MKLVIYGKLRLEKFGTINYEDNSIQRNLWKL